MDAFHAMSAPIRRDIITMLAENGQLSATDIAKRFRVSAPAISQHLKILRDSKLVNMHRQAQQRIYEIEPAAMLELESWANQIIQSINKITPLS